jgi:putative zinc finger protein
VHPFAELSAYLDSALDKPARVSVESHLAGCPLCRARLGELRATARLLALLPVPVPARSLVPRVSVPVWLAPIRTLATLASGAALFLFVASAVLSGIPTSMAPSVGGAPAAAPAQDRNAASGALAGGVPAPTSPPPGAAFRTTGSSAPVPAQPELTSALDSARASAIPTAAAGAEAASPPAVMIAEGPPQRPQLGPSPWLWLGLGVMFGAVAIFLQRRLRAA